MLIMTKDKPPTHKHDITSPSHAEDWPHPPRLVDSERTRVNMRDQEA